MLSRSTAISAGAVGRRDCTADRPILLGRSEAGGAVPAGEWKPISSATQGYTPAQYVQTVRIREAEKLLLTTTQSVSQIGMQVGLDNPSYFATLFKQKTGFTPTAYRQQHLTSVQNEAAR